MSHVYVLKLVEGKYYVGKSDDVDARIAAHFGGQGSAYTRTHPPLHIVEVIEGGNEDDTVLEYMHKYGIDNVRGGAFSMANISEELPTINRMLRSKYDLCFGCGTAGHFQSVCPLRPKPMHDCITRSSSTVVPETEPITWKTAIGAIMSGIAEALLSDSDDSYDDDEPIVRAHAEPAALAPIVRAPAARVPAARVPAPAARAVPKAAPKNGCSRCGRSSHTSGNCYAATNVYGKRL